MYIMYAHYKTRPPPIAQIYDGINNRGVLYIEIPRGAGFRGDSRNTSSAGFTDLNPAPRGLSY